MYTWNLPCDRLGILSISSILPQILPQTSSQTQGNSRVSRMEHQTPSVFPGNFQGTQSAGDPLFSFLFAGKPEPNPEIAQRQSRNTGSQGRRAKTLSRALDADSEAAPVRRAAGERGWLTGHLLRPEDTSKKTKGGRAPQRYLRVTGRRLVTNLGKYCLDGRKNTPLCA